MVSESGAVSGYLQNRWRVAREVTYQLSCATSFFMNYNNNLMEK
jgi:hypothetical protein